jgi:signal transduction histidine kinase
VPEVHSTLRTYQELVEGLPDVVFRLDAGLRFTFISPSVERFASVTATSIVGQALGESILPPSFRDAIQACLNSASGTSGIGCTECVEHGRYFRIRIVADAGENAMLGVIEDVTAARWRGERRRLRDALLRTVTAARSEVDAIDALLTAVRELGAATAAFVPATEASRQAALMVPVMCGDELVGAVQIGASDERTFGDEERAFVVTLAHQCGLALRRVREAEAARAERIEATATSERLRREADVLERLVNIVGHDLRSPLNAIILTAQALAETPVSPKAVQRIQRSATRMQRMIQDILDVARVRHAGGLPLEPRSCDLIEIIADQVDELRRTYPDREFVVETVPDGHGSWDPNRLAELLSNLLCNAVAHGSAGPIGILLGGAAEWVELHVTNPGAIALERLPALFDPFSADRPARQSRQGLGLGLFISRAIVEAHGGTIEAVAGDGATDVITRLPRQPRYSA